MPHIEITKLRPEGLFMIPAELRKGFKEGEELVVTRVKNRLVVEKVSSMSEKDKEDLAAARRTDEAWKRYERGEFKSLPFDGFIEQMKTW